MEPTPQEHNNDVEAFKRIVYSRVSMKNFLTREVPDDVLKAILSVTQVCSGFVAVMLLPPYTGRLQL